MPNSHRRCPLRAPLRSVALAAAALGLVPNATSSALAVKLPSPAGAPSCRASAGMPATERALVRLINRRRAAVGLRRLSGHRQIRRAARGNSRRMVRRNIFAHSIGLRWARGRPAAENLAYAKSPRRAMTLMMRSPAHRRNLLNPRWRWIGTGVTGTCAGMQFYTVTLMRPGR